MPPLHFTRIGLFWDRLNTHSLNTIKCKKWAKTPYQTMTSWETSRRILLEGCSNWTWDWFRSWLFCIQHLPCSVSLWCMLGGSHVEVWTKNIHYCQLLRAKLILACSLALDEPKYITLPSNSNTTSKHALHVERIYWFCMQIKQWKNDQFCGVRSNWVLRDDHAVNWTSLTHTNWTVDGWTAGGSWSKWS